MRIRNPSRIFLRHDRPKLCQRHDETPAIRRAFDIFRLEPRLKFAARGIGNEARYAPHFCAASGPSMTELFRPMTTEHADSEYCRSGNRATARIRFCDRKEKL